MTRVTIKHLGSGPITKAGQQAIIGAHASSQIDHSTALARLTRTGMDQKEARGSLYWGYVRTPPKCGGRDGR